VRTANAETVVAVAKTVCVHRTIFYSDAFCLFYDATTRSVKALNGSGRAPEKLSIEYLLSRGITGEIPPTNLNSVTVPGAAAAWVDTVEVFGSGKLTVAEVLEPAIRLAEEGYVNSSYHLPKARVAQVDAALNIASLCLRFTVIRFEFPY
jgi:gamma-glutamyltranspeptidase